MLIIALVLAVISLAALVTAVVTSNELIAWVCIGLSALGVLLLIIDAIRDRNRRLGAAPAVLPSERTEVIDPIDATEVIEPVDSEAVVIAADPEPFREDELPEDELPEDEFREDEFPADQDRDDEVADYPDDDDPEADDPEAAEDHPDEVIFDEPDYDIPSDDEPVYPMPAEEAAIHTVNVDDVIADAETEPPESYSEYSEVSEQPYNADSVTVIYAGEPSVDESATLTESYVVIHADEADAIALPEESSAVVIYADESDEAETGGSAVLDESGSER